MIRLQRPCLLTITLGNYSQTCANGHLCTMSTCQQQPAQIPWLTKPTVTLPRILDHTLNSSHPLNNGHFLGVQRGLLCTGLTVYKNLVIVIIWFLLSCYLSPKGITWSSCHCVKLIPHHCRNTDKQWEREREREREKERVWFLPPGGSVGFANNNLKNTHFSITW